MKASSDLGFDKYLLLAADCVCLHSVLESIFTTFLPTLETQQVFGAVAGDLNKFLSDLFCVCVLVVWC